MKVDSYKTPAGKIAPAKQTRKKFHLPKKRTVFTWLLRTISIGVVLAALMFAYYSRDLPDPNKLLDRQVAESTKIFGRNGEMLYEIHGEIKRTQVNLDQISDNLKKATIAIEDKDFYKHHGISFTGIGRAVLRLVINLDRSGGGGSTITQQLVKNAILGNKNPWDRKPREAIMSIAIESRFSKDDILKLYLKSIGGESAHNFRYLRGNKVLKSLLPTIRLSKNATQKQAKNLLLSRYGSSPVWGRLGGGGCTKS
jgi:membrane peptidoglycan carboxypeptidase